MKKIKQIAALLLSANLILSFAACSNSYEEGQTSKDIETTQTTSATTLETMQEETTESTNAADYIPSPKEAYELLKPLYAEHGYDFDNWTVYSNTDERFELVGPNTEQAVSLSNELLLISTGTKDKLIFTFNSGKFKSFTVTFKNGISPYDLCDAILANCPDDYKLSGEELQNTLSEVINNGTAKWEKNGLNYQCLIPPYETEETVTTFSIMNYDNI